MTFAGDIPQGGTAQLMKTNVDDLVDGATPPPKLTSPDLAASDRLALLVSCVGRKLVMKQRVEEEVEAIRDIFGADTKIAGFTPTSSLRSVRAASAACITSQMTITALTEA